MPVSTGRRGAATCTDILLATYSTDMENKSGNGADMRARGDGAEGKLKLQANQRCSQRYQPEVGRSRLFRVGRESVERI